MRNRIDWPCVLRELRVVGLGQKEVAGYAETSQAAISRLATGRTDEPTHYVGQRILDLHEQKVRARATATTDQTTQAMPQEAT